MDNKYLQFYLNEYGNAKRLIAKYHNDIRYIKSLDKWLIWQDTHWEIDEKDEILHLAKTIIDDLYKEAEDISKKLEVETQKQVRKKLAEELERITKHANRSSKFRKIKEIVDITKSDPELIIDIEELDKNPNLFVCQNGTYDLSCYEFYKEFKRENYITKIANIPYNAEAKCEKWESFLKDVLENSNIIEYLQMILGYSLSGYAKEQSFYMFIGDGGNGKTTLVEAVKYLFGSYAKLISSKQFVKTNDKKYLSNLTEYKGVRFAYLTEVSSKDSLNDVFVKQVTGNDTIRAELRSGYTVEFKPETKIYLVTNHFPKVNDFGKAIYRRIKPIVFNKTFVGNKEDKNKFEEIKSEATGILNWMLIGHKKWMDQGKIPVPVELIRDLNYYRVRNSKYKDFILEYLDFHPNYAITAKQFVKYYNDMMLYRNKESRIEPYQAGIALKDLYDNHTQNSIDTLYTGIGINRAVKSGINYLPKADYRSTLEEHLEYYREESSKKIGKGNDDEAKRKLTDEYGKIIGFIEEEIEKNK